MEKAKMCKEVSYTLRQASLALAFCLLTCCMFCKHLMHHITSSGTSGILSGMDVDMKSISICGCCVWTCCPED